MASPLSSKKSCVATKCSPDTSSKHVEIHTKRSHSGSETDVLSDDSTENIKKRRCQKTESDSDDSISTECNINKNVCNTEEGSSDSSQVSSLSRHDTNSPIFMDGIKKNTSEWTIQCLPNFRIETDTSVPSNKLSGAYEVFTNGYVHFIDKKINVQK
ncbi:unnamed protein product [Mytilus edulis]|uniref:Uncharacterized protein n=1 Tax=Mytilus edulis TaxID=6550 RepID=A0A8S3R8B5_MYTED|nr:unnamed protein product [Mytilus edulis]